MGAFDNFMIHYQNVDLMDINNVIFEALIEGGNDVDSVEMVAPALYARGYVIVPIEGKEVGDVQY